MASPHSFHGRGRCAEGASALAASCASKTTVTPPCPGSFSFFCLSVSAASHLSHELTIQDATHDQLKLDIRQICDQPQVHVQFDNHQAQIAALLLKTPQRTLGYLRFVCIGQQAQTSRKKGHQQQIDERLDAFTDTAFKLRKNPLRRHFKPIQSKLHQVGRDRLRQILDTLPTTTPVSALPGGHQAKSPWRDLIGIAFAASPYTIALRISFLPNNLLLPPKGLVPSSLPRRLFDRASPLACLIR